MSHPTRTLPRLGKFQRHHKFCINLRITMKFSALVASALVASAAAADYIMWNAPSVSFDDPALWANPDGKFFREEKRVEKKREKRKKQGVYSEGCIVWIVGRWVVCGCAIAYCRLCTCCGCLGGTANTTFFGWKKLLSRRFSPGKTDMPTYYPSSAHSVSLSLYLFVLRSRTVFCGA